MPTLVLLLFASGACALVYQTVWLRSLRLIFGASTPATAAVLAIFMGGLGLGAAWLGRAAERRDRPLRLYALLEVGVALGAALSLVTVQVVHAAYVAVGGAELGGVAATVVRVALATLVIGPPAILMGGTLPAVARAATTSADAGRQALALLYGVNTLGSVAGCLLTTFALFETWGVARTTLVACGVNVVVALLALRADRGLASCHVQADERAARVDAPWVLVAAFAVGFVFFLAELVWYRLASPVLGGSTYTFGLILATALLGIGLGGVLYSLRGREATPAAFAVTCALEAALLAAPLALGDDLAVFAFHLRAAGATSFAATVAGWSVVVAVIVLPASIVAGYQLPLLLALAGRGPDGVARDVGRVYAANTLGAIVGSLAGGFGLLPLLTAPGAWRAAACLAFLVAGAAAVLPAARHDVRRLVAVIALGAVALLFVSSQGPTAVWRHSAIGAGRGDLARTTWNEAQEARLWYRRTSLQELEGRESSLSFSHLGGLSLLVNGKSDGNAHSDAMTTVLLGLLGAILHEEPRSAFVIGLGSGQTAGWLAAVPSMQSVEVAELEPGVVEFARLCAVANHDVVSHPKARIRVGDGREQLLARSDRFDLIVSEPSNPYRAGVASLYSVDFYEQARARLAPGGLFVQWLQAYEVDAETIRIVMASLRSAFPHVSVWKLQTDDLALVASSEPQVVDLSRLRARLGAEPYRTGFGRISGVFEAEGVLALHLGGQGLADAAAARPGPLNTDDHPILEYRFARTVGTGTRTASPDLLNASQRARADRPTVTGDVDWALVERLRPRTWHVLGRPCPDLPMSPENRRLNAFWRALEDNDLEASLRLTRSLPPPPEHDLFARLAWAHVRSLRPGGPAERERLESELDALAAAGLATDVGWLRLQLAIIRREHQDLLELATTAFALARDDPWVRPGPVTNGLKGLAEHVSDGEVARALARALLEGPFALHLAERERRQTARALALRSGDDRLAAAAFALDEPSPIWTAESLEARARSYRAAGVDLAAQAQADLDLFLAHDSPRLADLLEPTPR